MQSLFLTCLLVCNIGCYKLPRDMTRDIHPYLLPYVEQFEERTGTKVNFKVTINNSMAEAGKCHYSIEYYIGTKFITPEYIEVNVAYFEDRKLSDETKALGIEQVLEHELLHCLKGRQHNNSEDTNNCPVSVMYESEFGTTACYKRNRATYLQEAINAFAE